MKSKLLAATAVLALAIAGGHAASAKTLVYCSENSPENFYPAINTTGTSFDASARQIYNRLVEFERGTTKIEPGLATRLAFGTINSVRDTGVGFAGAGYGAHLDGGLTELSYYWSFDQSRIVPKAAFEYVRAATGSFQEMGGLDPVSATGATQERSRILVGAEIGHYWIINQKILDLSAYGKFVDNLTQNFSSTLVSLGPETITVQGLGESRYGADAGASASLSLNDTVRLYVNYDGKFRAINQSHQGTLGVEVKW